MSTIQGYKNKIENNRYIQHNLVINFLQEGMIADYELIAEIFNNGMSVTDYNHLHIALEELGGELDTE
jgi:hypothetical protein